jgi:predicted GNAT superfamily acetyltransferase
MIEIRSCKGIDELEACVQLQIETWGYDPTDVIPRKAFLVWRRRSAARSSAPSNTEIARESEAEAVRIAGRFRHVFARHQTFAEKGPKPYLHSHMLAVRESTATAAWARNSSWNSAVRRFPAESATWNGPSIRWKSKTLSSISTGWEPSRASYLVDFYGVSSSRLQGGLPTDRLVAEWELDSPRVKAILAQPRARSSHVPIEERILVPASIYQWKAGRAVEERALAVQLENRQKFQQAFSRVWQWLASPAMRKEMEFSSWAPRLAGIGRDFQDEDFYEN